VSNAPIGSSDYQSGLDKKRLPRHLARSNSSRESSLAADPRLLISRLIQERPPEMGLITRHPRQIFLHVDEVVAGHN
jgi:hypothetical protein